MSTQVRTLTLRVWALIPLILLLFILFLAVGDRYLPEPLKSTSAQQRTFILKLVQPILRQISHWLPEPSPSNKGGDWRELRCQVTKNCP